MMFFSRLVVSFIFYFLSARAAASAFSYIVTGQHWRAAEVANRLIEVFDLYGFESSASGVLSWQAEDDMDVELEDNNIDAVKREMREERFAPVVNLLRAMGV